MDDEEEVELPTCGLCGHQMTLTCCGSAVADGVRLCHSDTHSCYHRWTVHGERPPTTPPPWDLWGGDYAVIRALGALRHWEGRVWRWHGHGWDLVR